MNAQFGSLADEFSVSARLVLKLDLALGRETILHFFEQVRKAFPAMDRFRRREDNALVLEEQPEGTDARRWVRLDLRCLRFGHQGPADTLEVRRLADVVLDQATYHLALSDLDLDHSEVVYSFDLEYRGNHDQLVAETFWADHPLAPFLTGPHVRQVIDAQPYLGVALSPACDLQAYVEIKSHTTTYEVRTGEYDSQALAVCLTVRKYWGVDTDVPLLDVQRNLFDVADELAGGIVVPVVVNPLAQAIASQS